MINRGFSFSVSIFALLFLGMALRAKERKVTTTKAEQKSSNEMKIEKMNEDE